MTGDSFTCPRCGRTSHNPTDIREGYCGACHDWTGSPQQQKPRARIELHLINEADETSRIEIPIGRIPIPPDRPPLTSDVLAVLRRTMRRVEEGTYGQHQFDQITRTTDDTE